MSIGIALLVLFVLHGQADYVPVREQTHAQQATSEVPSQNEDGEDRERAWGCEPVALEGDTAAVKECEDSL